VCPNIYALARISLAVMAIVNLALSFVPGAHRTIRDSWFLHRQRVRSRPDLPVLRSWTDTLIAAVSAAL
jgi:hypothetical protein